MIQRLSRVLALILSAVLIFLLLYFQIKLVYIQQILLVLIVIFALLLRSARLPMHRSLITWLLILMITFFIQLLIASTGAIFSPFLVLIHLYIIGLALFFDFGTALSFLILEFVLLICQARLDANLSNLIQEDIGAVLIYFSSLLVVTPVSKLVSQQYHVKADTLKILFKELTAKERILEQLDDFVITTDKNLQVLSGNDSAQKIINTAKKDVLTSLLNLTDNKGQRLTKAGLLLSLSSFTQDKAQIGLDKLSIAIPGYTLTVPGQKTSPKVIIKANPVINQEEEADKFIFVISRVTESGSLTSQKLSVIHHKYSAVLDLLKQDPNIIKSPLANFYLNLVNGYEIDLLIAAQINQITKPPTQITDLFRLIAKIYEQHQQLARQLNIGYELILPDELQEEYQHKIAGNTLPEDITPPSTLSVVTNPFLLQILLEKVAGLTASLAYTSKRGLPAGQKPKAVIKLALLENCFKLTFQTAADPALKEISLQALNNLSFSSGLESCLIKNIADLLGIAFAAEYSQSDSKLSFTLTISKYFS